MRFLKSSCVACSHSAHCSSQTRMYVNYCGADRARMLDRIRRAEIECRNRQGYTLTFRQNALPAPLMEALALKTAV